MFEIAADPAAGQAVLQAYPDVLLVEQATPPAILCSRGVIFFDTLFPERPAGVELRARPFHDVDGYELVIGEYRFRFPYDPGELIGRLDRWFGYFFDHFLPRVPEVYTWKSPGPGKVVRLHDMISCPECKTRFLPRLGELGIRVDEAWHGPKAVEPAGSV